MAGACGRLVALGRGVSVGVFASLCAVAYCAALGLTRAVLRRRRSRAWDALLFFDRKSSNNAARVRLWMALTGLDGAIAMQSISHAQQHTEEYQLVNPFRKVPALLVRTLPVARAIDSNTTPPASTATATAAATVCPSACEGVRWLGEAAVIAEFLEELRLSLSRRPQRFIPRDPWLRAHMNLAIRSHDLYIGSPNCTQPGPFTHTQGCMYVPPPGTPFTTTRWIERPERAAKLAECWKQLDVLEELMLGPYFCGECMTLADLAVYPTMVFFDFYPPRVFGWADSALFHNRPRLRRWYEQHMRSWPAVRQVHAELYETLLAKEATGVLDTIRAEAADASFKWVYP